MDFFSGFLMSNSSGTFHALGHNWLGKADIAVQTVLLSGGFVVVALRLWSRRLLGVSWQWNDWLILASMMVMLGRYVVELLLILMCGLGLHTAEVTQLDGDETIVRFDKLTYIGDLLWITVVALIQLSILHYYFPKKLALAPVYLLGLIILTATLIRIKIEFDLNSNDPTFGSARKSILSCIVPLLGIIVACLPIISPSIQRIFRTKILSSPSEGATYGYRSSYYKPTVLSGRQMEEPEIPLVSVMQPPMAKKLSEWCHGQIKITSDWEIHSTRNSARLDKDLIRKV
ncbi:hypothetical protein N7454_007785 [Penicillium verhagenii]|nr:hypothetical protein N7454_007785 [Penicillium verhagenii]